jgi:hypothetical protein
MTEYVLEPNAAEFADAAAHSQARRNQRGPGDD